VKALSLLQPWAWAVVNPATRKRVENRTWAPPRAMIGREFLLHASRGGGAAYHREAAKFIRRASGGAAEVPPRRDLPRGAIVGVARLVGYASRERDGAWEGESRWREVVGSPWFVGPHGWLLSDVRPLPHVEVAGHLGFFEVPDAALVALTLAAPEVFGVRRAMERNG